MKIGAYLYRNKPVFVIYYRGEPSWFATFRYIRKDGTLGKGGGDYPDGHNFKPLKHKLVVKLLKKQ